MKKLEAVIHPAWLDRIKDSLATVGVPGMTVTQVHSMAAGKGTTLYYRGSKFKAESVARYKVELVVNDGLADTVVDVLTEAARAGGVENGEIYVLPVSQVIYVRAGKREPVAPTATGARVAWQEGFSGLPAFAWGE